ncbi:DUF6377 domain-containing protein [Mucilaginibacter sp.]
MRAFTVIGLLLFFHAGLLAADRNDTLINRLITELGNKGRYDRQKEQKINTLRSSLQLLQPGNIAEQFNVNSKLYYEYRSYQYDSAYVYADRLRTLSLKANDPSKQEESKVQMAFVLLSSGKYKEAFTLLEAVKRNVLSYAAKLDYYSVMSRAYFDLADYDNDKTYSTSYRARGNSYIDSSLLLSKPDSYSQLLLIGYKNYRLKNYRAAIARFLHVSKLYHADVHENAIIASLLSEAYAKIKAPEQTEEYLIKAAIGDLQTATKETQALFKLAELTSKKGDINHAYLFIQEALKDAEFYGARQRQVQISSVLPLLSAQKVDFLERQRQRFIIYLCSTLGLTLLVVIASILLYKQLRQRRAKERIIEQNNAKLHQVNSQLKEVNKLVVQANQKFAEDAHIKEEYIGNFFHIISEYILKLEKLKTSIEAKIVQNKLEQIMPLVNSVSIHKERNALYNTFDSVFLKIFPNFITAFNSLFKKEDQISPKDHEMLTTDLRIFALIRLGIDDNESIARILQYTTKTVYVYKMRLKAKSIYPSDEFDRRLMSIQAVENPQEIATNSG